MISDSLAARSNAETYAHTILASDTGTFADSATLTRSLLPLHPGATAQVVSNGRNFCVLSKVDGAANSYTFSSKTGLIVKGNPAATTCTI